MIISVHLNVSSAAADNIILTTFSSVLYA